MATATESVQRMLDTGQGARALGVGWGGWTLEGRELKRKRLC